MEGGFGFPFGGDPEELMRGLREFAEKQAETVHETQREQFATLTLNTAVELTGAALSQLNPTGPAEEQAMALRDAMRVRSSAPPAKGSCARADLPIERACAAFSARFCLPLRLRRPHGPIPTCS